MEKRLVQREKYYLVKVLLDGLLLTIAFFTTYSFRKDSENLFLIVPIVWFIVTSLSKKFMKVNDNDYFNRLKPYLRSTLALAGILTIVLYVFGRFHVSRMIVFGSIGLFFIFELIVFTVEHFCLSPMHAENTRHRRWIPAVFFLGELSLFIFSFTVIYIGVVESQTPNTPQEQYFTFFMAVIFLWIVMSMAVHKFEIRKETNYVMTIAPFLLSECLIIGVVSIPLYLLHLFKLSYAIVLGVPLVITGLELLTVSLFYLFSGAPVADETRVSLFRIHETHKVSLKLDVIDEDTQIKKYRFSGSDIRTTFFNRKLKEVHLRSFSSVYEFIDQHVALNNIDLLNAMVIYSNNPTNIEILNDCSLQFFSNLRQMNDLRQINEYYRQLNLKMAPGGICVGKFESLSQTKNRFFSHHPPSLATAFYPFFFLFKLIFPKIPGLRQVYFGVTRGHRRVLSEAEALGRLYFCGFEIIGLKEIDHYTWFIVKKVKAPSPEKNPSYGFIFKQKRIGKGGKYIHIYKLRTMYPYSEYIHKYVLSHYALDESGKIKNDFRITGWGKVLRKLWIDELPMIWNWIKRDLKLVGVRPLSQSFFDLYPEDLKRERTRYKPGLIPPYYADMPNTIQEIFKSEYQYLRYYSETPFKTDITYLMKSLNNILFHHAKSA
ncbi:MAG: sugar transferase [Candidatus Omnitrophota bacterium]